MKNHWGEAGEVFLGAALVLVLIFILTGCSSSPPKERIVTQRVEVPISRPCRPALSPKPVYPTEQRPIETDVFKQMAILLAERDLRIGRIAELEAGLAGCAGQ